MDFISTIFMHKIRAEKLLAVDNTKLINDLFGNYVTVKDISNHDDIRNRIYIIGEKRFILKLYADKIRWKREVTNYLKKNPCRLLTPKLVDFGMYDGDIGWLLMTYVDEKGLEDIYEHLDDSKKIDLWNMLGKMLADFHIHNIVSENSLYLVSELKDATLKEMNYYEKLMQDYIYYKDKIIHKEYNNKKIVFRRLIHLLLF